MTLSIGCSLAYLLGGIPFGLVLVRLFLGVDIRSIGSGNIGATNASRAFGGKLRLAVFLLIYVLDFLKGFVPAWWGPAWFGGSAAAPVLLGASAIIGHCASPFLGFRGGKGVATATGVVAALDVSVLGIGLAVFFVVRAVTGEVFLGSLGLGVALAAAMILVDVDTAFGVRLPQTVFCLVVAAFLFFTHRSNLRAKFARRRPADTL